MLVAASLAAAACGTRVAHDAGGPPRGGTTSATSGTPGGGLSPQEGHPEPTSGQGVTNTEILIGGSAPLSGLVAPLGGEALGAVDSYFKWVNSKGGVNGRRLRLLSLDDYLEPTATLANARRLNESDRVLALMLGFGDATADYVTRHEIPTMTFGLGPVAYSSHYPTIYPLVGNALSWGHALIAGLQQIKVFKSGMRVAVLYDTDELYTGPFVDFIVQAWELAGAKVVSRDAFNLAGQDCTQLVIKMRGLDIDWWDFQGLGAVPCLQAAGQQGFRPDVGWGSWATSIGVVAQNVGAAIEGVWGESQGDSVTGAPRGLTDAHSIYVEAIKRFHPELATPIHLESPVTIGYWTGAEVLVKAIEAQGATVTRQGVNKWIQGRKGYATGLGMPIDSMAPGCKTGNDSVWLGRWRWEAGTISRAPETGYVTSPFREQFGGLCYLTKISDQLLG